jgi:pyridoxamine 5'-phosphate oxidase
MPSPQPIDPLSDALSGRCEMDGGTLPDPLPADPFPIFQSWLADAAQQKSQPNPNAMTLCTVSPDGRPSARIVLCRAIDPARGFLTFYTNKHSHKGRELAHNPRVAITFHWDKLDRQVRIEGLAADTTDAESDNYFNTRALGSRIGAWASQQSQPIADRADLLLAAADVMQRFNISMDTDLEHDRSIKLPRPPHWGGYRVFVDRLELWLGHSQRLHDRAAWSRTLSPATIDNIPGYSASPWSSTRLQP